MDEPTVQQLMGLSGKCALVTGAAGHLGSAMSRALAEAGATVIAASRDAQRAEALARGLPNVAGEAHSGVVLDTQDPASIESGFRAAVRLAGRVDVLVNNGHEAESSDWTNVTPDAFNRQLANVTGYFLLSRFVRDYAVQRQAPASVILVGSMYGLVSSYPEVYRDLLPASPVAYHACKAAILQLNRHLAVYWAKDRVRVNCLCPGAFPLPDRVSAELTARLCQKTPLGRVGQSHELKASVVFLASEASSFMTGQNLIVDGGWTAC
jgi:NAD(P)-dependent dehydrogenase (short-subunit alcohol dehydrogenase family)